MVSLTALLILESIAYIIGLVMGAVITYIVLRKC